MQKQDYAVRWLALLLALFCAMSFSTALYAADEPEASPEPGLLIVAVDPNGPAAAAGLARGDIVLSVDGTRVNSIADLATALAAVGPATPITLQVQHGDEQQAVKVIAAMRNQRAYLGILPYGEPAAMRPATPLPIAPSAAATTTIEVAPAQPATVPDAVTPSVNTTIAFAIREVATGSAAAVAGLQPGDMITALDGEAMADPAALRTYLANRQPGDTITLTVVRGAAAPADVVLTLGQGPEGQAQLGVTMGVMVTATLEGQGAARFATPAMPLGPLAPPVPELHFGYLQDAVPFAGPGLAQPGCMPGGASLDHGQPAPHFMQFRQGVMTMPPVWLGQAAVPTMAPAGAEAVIVVQGQPIQSRMIVTACQAEAIAATAASAAQEAVTVTMCQPAAIGAQLALPAAQTLVIGAQTQAGQMLAQPAALAEPESGAYY